MITDVKTPRHRDELVLATFLNGTRVGNVFQSAAGTLRFAYLESWRTSPAAYPLSLSMPLTAVEHRHDVINAFL